MSELCANAGLPSIDDIASAAKRERLFMDNSRMGLPKDETPARRPL
jgi:hypothetical protein